MLASQTIELRLVEIRAAIAAHPADGETGALEALTTEYRAADVRRAACLITESADLDAARAAGDLDAGQRELDGIGSNLQFRNYVSAAVEMRAADGREAEYNAGIGMSARQFPLAILAPTRVQMRATTDADGQANQNAWLDRLFADSAASRLGISMESVPPGQAVYMTTTAGATGEQRSRSQAADAAPWTVGVKTMEPKRNAVHAVYSIEDSARLPGLSDGLRRDLGMALTDAIDVAIFVGDNGASTAADDITGLSGYAGLTEVTLTQAQKIMADDTLKSFSDMVDGRHAMDLSDLNIVASVGSYRLWLSTIHAAAVDNQTVAQFMMASGLSWGSRAGIDTNTGNGDYGAFVSRARGLAGAGVAALWNAGQMIVDEITGADKGEVKLTLNYLWQFDLPRASNFARLKYVT